MKKIEKTRIVNQNEVIDDILCINCKCLTYPPPQMCGNCFFLLCAYCQKQSSTCSNCKESSAFCQIPSMLATQFNKLLVECENKELGCPEVISYSSIKEHQQNCDFQKMNCPGCKKTMLKKEFKIHINECNLIKEICKTCGDEYLRKDKDSHNCSIGLLKKIGTLESKVVQLEGKFCESEMILDKLSQTVKSLSDQITMLNYKISVNKEVSDFNLKNLAEKVEKHHEFLHPRLEEEVKIMEKLKEREEIEEKEKKEQLEAILKELEVEEEEEKIINSINDETRFKFIWDSNAIGEGFKISNKYKRATSIKSQDKIILSKMPLNKPMIYTCIFKIVKQSYIMNIGISKKLNNYNQNLAWSMDAWCLAYNGFIWHGESVTKFDNFMTGDKVGIKYDRINGTIEFIKNGVGSNIVFTDPRLKTEEVYLAGSVFNEGDELELESMKVATKNDSFVL